MLAMCSCYTMSGGLEVRTFSVSGAVCAGSEVIPNHHIATITPTRLADQLAIWSLIVS